MKAGHWRSFGLIVGAGLIVTVSAGASSLSLESLDLIAVAERTALEPAGVPPATLERRRSALFEMMEPGIAVIRSADPRELSQYPQDSDFRQNNDFYYLTGLETPSSWLLLLKPKHGEPSATLYAPLPTATQRVWAGGGPTPPEAARRAGLAEGQPLERFAGDVMALLAPVDSAGEYPRLYLALDTHAEVAELTALAEEAGVEIVDVRGHLAALRQVKDSVELERLRRAVSITVDAQRAAIRAAQPGMHEYEIEAIIEYVFRSQGAERVGFPSIVGSGPNSVVLHYDENRRRMEAGELVVMDIGAEYGYYTADVTRTIPVSGTFTERQQAIYELVLATQQAVIDSVRPGRTMFDLERIARLHMRTHSNGLCGEATCDRFFPHGVSHWLGMDVHDVGSYAAPLAPGMVLTIEPGIYLPDEALGVRIEDDVLVTAEGREVLSDGAPRTVAEIEAVMAAPCAAGTPAIGCED